MLGALSLGDTQDSSMGGFHHGGALVILSLRKPRMTLALSNFFELLGSVNVIVPSGLWQARRTVHLISVCIPVPGFQDFF